MPDALELETLALAYRERYGIDLILLWHDDMMLGDLFAIAHPVAALPLRRSSLANAIEIYRYKTVIALAFVFYAPKPQLGGKAALAGVRNRAIHLSAPSPRPDLLRSQRQLAQHIARPGAEVTAEAATEAGDFLIAHRLCHCAHVAEAGQ